MFFSLRSPPGASPQALPPEVQLWWSLYTDLDRTQWQAPADLEQAQLAQVRVLLAHCIEHVPYYRARLTAAGIGPQDVCHLDDFRRLPLLTRQIAQERSEDLRARSLPSGTIPTARRLTSGTTGVPLEVSHTNVEQRWWWACYLRDLEWAGLDPRRSLAVIRPPMWKMGLQERQQYRTGTSQPSWSPPLDGLLQSGPCHALDIHQEPRLQLEWLRSIGPDYLVSYPSNLEALAGLLQDEGTRLPTLHAIQAISETLTQDVQRRIESAFGVAVKNLYSCGEAGYLASACPQGHGLHVHAEHVLLEVLDEAGQPCRPGQTGRVVLTTLHNFLTPLVRYEIDDEASVGPTPCPCGRGLPLLDRVWGKRRPLLLLPDGRRKNCDELTVALRYLGGLRQHQIIQRASDHLVVRVAAGKHWTTEHPERIRRLVGEFFGTAIRTEVEVLPRLEPLPNGKRLDVVIDMAPSGAGLQAATQVPEVSKVTAPLSRPQAQVRDTPRQGPAVLLGWEMGGGLGHVQQLGRLARALAEHGLRPVLAVKDLAAAGSLLHDSPYPVLQAPLWHARGQQPFLASSFADILAIRGFSAVEDLWPLVQAWQGLIDLVRPALVVCDHSPTLTLAAFATVPTVILGHAFSMPPADVPTFPLLLPGRRLLVPEDQLLAVVREVQRRRGRPAPNTLPGLFAAERFLTVLPELDPYQAFRHEPHRGPLDFPLSPPLPPPVGPSFFAYLSTDVGCVEMMLTGLARAGYPGTAYVRGSTPALRERLRQQGLQILDAPAAIPDILPQVEAVIHHGGAGLSQQALAAGRPQLLFPDHLERILNAQLLQRLGAGLYLTGQLSEAVVTEELFRLLGDVCFAERARAAAAGIQARGPWDPLPAIVERCLALVRQRPAHLS